MQQQPLPSTPGAQEPAPAQQETPGGHPIEIWISYVLRIGVLTAGAVILFGVVLFFIQGPRSGDPRSFSQLLHRGSVSISPASIWHGISRGDATAVILFGAVLLILTPVTRVAMTCALFIMEQDRIFVLITAVVLAVLLLGLTGLAH